MLNLSLYFDKNNRLNLNTLLKTSDLQHLESNTLVEQKEEADILLAHTKVDDKIVAGIGIQVEEMRVSAEKIYKCDNNRKLTVSGFK